MGVEGVGPEPSGTPTTAGRSPSQAGSRAGEGPEPSGTPPQLSIIAKLLGGNSRYAAAAPITDAIPFWRS